LNEFAPSGDDDGDHGPDEEEILHRLASIWWLGNEQQMARAERALASMGWEIGEDEGYDDGGVFVVRAGDVNGKSYISWPHEDLQLSEAAPVNLNDPQYQQIDQPSRDFGQRTFPVTGGDSITGQPLPPKFAPGKETVPRLPSADNKTTSSSTGTSTTIDSDHVSADQIGNVFKAVQDVDQEYRDKDAAKRADPAKAAQMKQSYQDRIVNPEFMNDLSDTDAEPVTPAKPVYNNPDADTGDTVGNKINSVGDQKGVAASTTTSSPPPPAKMPAKQITSVKPPAAGSWQELAQLNKSTIPNPDRIYPGQKIKITPYGDEYVVKPGDTLSSIAKSMKGMDTPRRLKENTARTDLYQILRNAGLKNTP
jgi:LysM repeat protein